MPFSIRRLAATTVLVLAISTLAAGGVFADPKGKGHGHHDQDDQGEDEDGGRSGGGNVTVSFNFSDGDRAYLQDYYGGEQWRGHCPPGLAKKHNGCMPPGQAKKWAVGQRLPRDVVYYDLPTSMTVHLTPPPSGYKYVRVAKDILLIGAGTGMVAAGLTDLVR